MSNKLQKYLVNNNKNRTFTNKTFNEFRSDLLRYANEFYSDNILDFSEASLGGLFLDFASIVGDSLVYYAEQQFNEMDYETAVDPENISRFLRKANIKNLKGSPSIVEATFTVTIPANEDETINENYLPLIKKNSVISSSNGIHFSLVEDLDFRKGYVKTNTNLNDSDNITSYDITKKGTCISGKIESEFVTFANESGKFLKYTLEDTEITKIISVYDEERNEYYEVDYLSQDFVYNKVENSSSEEKYMVLKPVPYRYIIEEDYDTGLTTLRFGNGDNTNLVDNKIADPTDLLLPLINKDYTGRLDISPDMILNNNMLGITPSGRTLTITYRTGSGKNHNISANSINKVIDPIVLYPNLESIDDTVSDITNSISLSNDDRAIGGREAPNLDEVKKMYETAVKMQSRIVTYEDLLTSLTLMPSDFGKIYKVAAIDNKNIVGLKDIYVVCKDENDYLTNATDIFKQNVSKYINTQRLIGDNFNIVDCPIFNFSIKIKLKIKEGYESFTVITQLVSDIINLMRFDTLSIGEAIDVNKLTKIIESNPGILTIVTPKRKIISSKSSDSNSFDFNSNIGLNYSNNRFNPILDYDEGLIFPTKGGIFELKYPINDIEILISN